jgi:hypothetical protein
VRRPWPSPLAPPDERRDPHVCAPLGPSAEQRHCPPVEAHEGRPQNRLNRHAGAEIVAITRRIDNLVDALAEGGLASLLILAADKGELFNRTSTTHTASPRARQFDKG